MDSAVASFVVKKVGDRIVQEAINLHGVKDQVEWLEREQRRMQCFLQDADAKKNNGGIVGEREKNLVTEIIDLSSEVQKVISMSKKLNPRDFFGFVVWRFKYHSCVQGIRAKVKELSQSKKLYGIANIGETMGTTSSSIRSEDKPSILPPLNDDDIDKFGFDKEKEMIVRELVNTRNTNRSVISIVDMDSKRKIALVGAIYNDPEVRTSFELVASITISQKNTIIEILKNISSRAAGTSSIDAIEILEVNLIDILKKYKYLIILVDVCRTNVWDQLQNIFPDVNNGSRIILTNPTSLNTPDPTLEQTVITPQRTHISPRTRPHISQTLPAVTPRTSLSIPITEEILKSMNELKKTSIISVISGQTSQKHLQAVLGGRKISPFGINIFVISFHSEKEARTAESMDPIMLNGPHGPCEVSLVPWSPEFGSIRQITIVNLPLHCRDWATLVEVVKPVGDLVEVQKDERLMLEFVYVRVRLRRVIRLPLELELTVDKTQYLIHLEDSQTFEPCNSGRSTMEIALQKQGAEGPKRSTHEIPRKEKGKMLAGDGDESDDT